jgi:hypothetical protein
MKGIIQIYYFFIIIDYIDCVLLGIIKGIGLAEYGSKVFIIVAYGVGTTLSILLGVVFDY